MDLGGRLFARVRARPRSALNLFQRSHRPTSFLHRIILPSSPSLPISFVLLHRHAAHYTISIASVDAQTGSLLSSPTPLKHKIAHPAHILTFPGSSLAFIAQTGTVHSFRIPDSGEVGQIHSHTGSKPFIALESVNLEGEGIFVGRREKDSASVLRIDANGVVSQAWDFSDQVRSRMPF